MALKALKASKARRQAARSFQTLGPYAAKILSLDFLLVLGMSSFLEVVDLVDPQVVL